jgi:hypothetical protein
MAGSDSEQNVNSEAEKVIIHEIPLSEYAKSLEDSNSQILRLWCICNCFCDKSCLHIGSVEPNIPRFYNVLNTDVNLLVCLPESWSHYSFSDG